MSFGFVVSRHVNNKQSDLYWKECYTCIRRFYGDAPILIIDDSSNKEFLNENMVLSNCTVIYDTKNKGAGELLPYYYFHLLRPFDTAIIIHDNVFLQSQIDFTTDSARFLWTFTKAYDHDIVHHIKGLCGSLLESAELLSLFEQKDRWTGCYGVMSVIKWEFLDRIDKRHNFFNAMLKQAWHRDLRSGLERAFALVVYYNTAMNVTVNVTMNTTLFGDIHKYMKWGTTFTEYLTQDHKKYPIVKVWASR